MKSNTETFHLNCHMYKKNYRFCSIGTPRQVTDFKWSVGIGLQTVLLKSDHTQLPSADVKVWTTLCSIMNSTTWRYCSTAYINPGLGFSRGGAVASSWLVCLTWERFECVHEFMIKFNMHFKTVSNWCWLTSQFRPEVWISWYLNQKDHSLWEIGGAGLKKGLKTVLHFMIAI